MGKFEEIYNIDVNDYVEQKGNLNYLSWAFAWREFKKVYPGAKYAVDKFDGSYCTGNEKMGYMVRTEVTADDITYEMWLPVMNHQNKTILTPVMTEINKTIMRCLTKNLAMFGLGLYIYAGEDLPNDKDGDNGEEKKPSQNRQISPNSNDRKKTEERITKAEMVEKWGVRNVEETILWFEKKLGIKYVDWDVEACNDVRAVLQAQKDKREREAKKLREGLNSTDGELPFDI